VGRENDLVSVIFLIRVCVWFLICVEFRALAAFIMENN